MVRIVDLESLAPERCGFESRQATKVFPPTEKARKVIYININYSININIKYILLLFYYTLLIRKVIWNLQYQRELKSNEWTNERTTTKQQFNLEVQGHVWAKAKLKWFIHWKGAIVWDGKCCGGCVLCTMLSLVELIWFVLCPCMNTSLDVKGTGRKWHQI